MLGQHLRGHQVGPAGRADALGQRLEARPGVLRVAIGTDAPHHVREAAEATAQVFAVRVGIVSAVGHDLRIPAFRLAPIAGVVRVGIAKEGRIEDDQHVPRPGRLKDLLGVRHVGLVRRPEIARRRERLVAGERSRRVG